MLGCCLHPALLLLLRAAFSQWTLIATAGLSTASAYSIFNNTITASTEGNTGACPPDPNNGGQISPGCVLPVNANITLRGNGADQLTSVDVSIDIYPDASVDNTAKDPAITHDTSGLSLGNGYSSTVIRVMLPLGFFVSPELLSISGGLDCVTLTLPVPCTFSNVTCVLPFVKVAPLFKGSGNAEPGLPVCTATSCSSQP